MPPPPFQRIFGFLTIPGILRIWVGFQGLVFVLMLVRGEANAGGLLAMLVMDWEEVMNGQVWRLLSFVVLPPVSPFSTLGLLFMFFVVTFTFFVNDILESAWGSRGLSAYFFSGLVFGLLASAVMAPMPMIGTGYLAATMLFAAGTVSPRLEVRLMLILPVPLYVVALLGGVAILAGVFGYGRFQPYLAAVPLLAVGNYLVWAVPILTRYLAHRGEVRERRSRFEGAKRPSGEAFHTCEKCGATEISHPEREFRVTATGQEMCEACRRDPQGN